MRLLVVSDLHGDLDSAREAIDRFAPDALLSCGDWGDPDRVFEADLTAFAARVPLLTTFGNHDPLDLLGRLRDGNGSPALLGRGEVRLFGGLRVAAIGGIRAKSHRLPHYVTDEDVAAAAAEIAGQGRVDVLLTHGCAIGLADRTYKGTSGGHRCFLEANRAIGPRVHVCGHLHRAQERTLKDGRQVLNVGETPAGSVVVIEVRGSVPVARLDRFDRGTAHAQ